MHHSKHVFRTIYFLTAAVLAVTTFTSPTVYGTWWFVTLWWLFATMLVTAVVRMKLWNNIPAMILHAAILTVLAGGFLTWSCSERGVLRLEPGQETSRFSGGELPFTIGLQSFEVQYYPGGTIPQDYISTVTIDGQPCRISMNKILKKQGYRFYQTSYDADGATILSVNHDPAGITVTYCGYIMFLVGGVVLMMRRKGNFRKLTAGTLCTSALLLFGGGNATASTISGITHSQADSLSARQVIYGGQAVTFNTLSREFVKKLYGKPTYRGLTSEQVLCSMLLYPEEWSSQPIIYVKNKSLRKYLDAEGKYISFSDLFDASGDCRLNQLYAKLDSKYNRAITSLDEKAGLIMTLYTGELIIPRSDDVPELSRMRIATELLYNRIPFSMFIFIMLFTGALTAFACMFGFDKLSFISWWLLMAALSLQTICFGMQWVLSGHVPLSNTYETLELTVILFLGLTALLGRRFKLLLPLGMLLGGAAALVAHINAVNPIVTPLMPVLASPWLSIHVMCVMSSYALLVLTFAVSIIGLCSPSSSIRLMTLNNIVLYPATLLLAAGIFAGSVWANVSWGRYWAWDPKETWALITLMYYAVPLHRSESFSDNPKRFHIYVICGLATVMMTYFGVNFMSSLHSYGS